MELKKFNDYTKKEQKDLLLHWWHYFGKVPYSIEEVTQFSNMIDKNSNEVMMLAVFGYIYKQTSEIIIGAMRMNNVDELIQTLPILGEKSDEFRTCYEQQEQKLLTQIVKTYNNPEPDVPLDILVIVADPKTRTRKPNTGKKNKDQY